MACRRFVASLRVPGAGFASGNDFTFMTFDSLWHYQVQAVWGQGGLNLGMMCFVGSLMCRRALVSKTATAGGPLTCSCTLQASRHPLLHHHHQPGAASGKPHCN